MGDEVISAIPRTRGAVSFGYSRAVPPFVTITQIPSSHCLPRPPCSSFDAQRLEDIVDEAVGVWQTILFMSYAIIQKHLAFESIM